MLQNAKGTDNLASLLSEVVHLESHRPEFWPKQYDLEHITQL